MKTAVVFKWCNNPQDALVKSDGSVDWGKAKLSPTDDDHAAMDVARSLSAESDIVGITLDGGKADWAAARGAASTILGVGLEDHADVMERAQALKMLVDSAGDVDVVTIGDSDWDQALVAALASKLGCPAFAGVVKCEPAGESIRVYCKNGAATNTVSVKPPVFIACKALSKEAAAPSMKQTLAARKKPTEKIDVSGSKATSHASIKTLRAIQDEAQPVVLFDNQDVRQACADLVATLQSEGVLD